jgi:hypothetical protein
MDRPHGRLLRESKASGGECSKLAGRLQDTIAAKSLRGLLERTAMDKLCYSHRCLLEGALVRVASVLVAPARPASSELLSRGSLSLFLSATPVASSLVLLDFGKIGLRPIAQSGAGDIFSVRFRHYPFLNPPMQR